MSKVGFETGCKTLWALVARFFASFSLPLPPPPPYSGLMVRAPRANSVDVFRTMLFVFLAAIAGQQLAHAEKKQVEYLIFEGGGPDQGASHNVSRNMAALKKKFGPIDPTAPRMYGYGVQQIRILTRSTPFLAREINRALEAAEQNDIPVWLHLDPLYGWGADQEFRSEDAPSVKFWKHPKMREWREFPAHGEMPSYIPRLWFNWGPWCSPVGAFPAIGSPQFVEFSRKQLREGVLTPLVLRLKKWNAEGRDYLFAGINIGWEIYIPNYHQGWLDAPNGVRKEPVLAEQPRTIRGLKMDESLVGSQLGYASLHWRGWTEERLREAAHKEGITRDEKFRQLCYDSMHDYMQVMAKECFDYGLSREKIYTHIVALASVVEPDTNMPEIWTSVNPYSTPGFTMDNKGGAKFNFEELKRQLAKAPGSRGTQFGAVETYFGLNGRNYVTDKVSYKKELDEMFDNGARIQAIFGAFPFTGRSPEAGFAAIRDWISETPR